MQNARLENAMLVTFLRSRMWLIIAGISCELFYFFYLLRQFSLQHYYPALTEMGIITRTSQAGFLEFILVFSALFALSALAWWKARCLDSRGMLWLILGFGGIFVFTTIFVYPINAIDVFNYIAESIVLLNYHANPMLVSLSQYPRDPLVGLTAGWGKYPAAYGPIGLCIDAIPTLFLGRNVLVSLVCLKVIFSAALLVEAFVVYKILMRVGPKFALSGALALAWNPFAILEYSANSHNDIIMVLFVLFAVLALVEERPILALVLITASALTKYSSLPLIPLFFVYSFSHQSGYQQRIRYTMLASGASLLLTFVVFIPFWAGSRTFDSFFFISRINLSSFSIFLNDISSQTISLDQAKQLGLFVFGCIYLYALFLSSRRIENMLRGCFITMFALLAFGVSNIQVWYTIWPFALAILVPSTGEVLMASLCIYGATLTELVHAYVWPWVNIQINVSAYYIVNSVAYLIIFLPALLLLFVLEGRYIFKGVAQKFATRKVVREEETTQLLEASRT